MSEEALVEVNVGAGVASTKGTVPKKEGISTTTNIHMESFFDGADTITESTASATVVTTREILVEALALPLRPISAE